MLFSVLIPVYNVEKYLRRCVESVLAQSFTDYEIILIDDGSTDQSSSICDQFADTYDNIRVFHKNNDGLYMARYDAIQQARGKYLLFLDSDDTIAKDALYILSKIITESNPDMVVFRFRLVENQTLRSLDSEILFSEGKIDKKNLVEAFVDTKINYLCMKCIKNMGNFKFTIYHHMNMAEDIAYTSQFLRQCQSIYYTTKVLYNYYINPTSITHHMNMGNLGDSTVAHYEMLEMLIDLNLIDSFKSRLINEYIKNMAYIVSEMHVEDIRSKQCTDIMTDVKRNKLWIYCDENRAIVSKWNSAFLRLLDNNYFFCVKAIGTIGLTMRSLLHLSNSRKNAKGIKEERECLHIYLFF